MLSYVIVINKKLNCIIRVDRQTDRHLFYMNKKVKFNAYIYLKSIVEINFSGSISTKSFHNGFRSILAHKSHKALMIGDVPK